MLIINCDAREFEMSRQVVSGVRIEKLDNLSLSSGAFLAALIAQLRKERYQRKKRDYVGKIPKLRGGV